MLPERYRSAVVLCYLEGLTHEAAADRLGRPVGTVRSRLADSARSAAGSLDAPRTGAGGHSGAYGGRHRPDLLFRPRLEEATVRAALKIVLKKTALGGVASAEAVALMEGTIKTVMINRFFVGMSSAIGAGFLAVSAGAMAYSVLAQEKLAARAAQVNAGVIKGGASAQEKVAGEAPTPAPLSQRVQGQAGKALGRGPIVIQAETVDSKGQPLAGVDLGLSVSYALGAGKTKSEIERATSNNQGRGKLEVAAERPGERAVYGFVWAYHPGRALAVTGIPIADSTPPEPVRLVLEEPVKRTITVVGPHDLPIEGVRLLPQTFNAGVTLAASIPGEWVERLTVTTDAKGVATIPYLSRAMSPMTARVSGPRLAPHTLAIPAEPGKDPIALVLKLGRAGRLAGVVRTESGQPVADVAVEVWIRAAGVRPIGMACASFEPSADAHRGREVRIGFAAHRASRRISDAGESFERINISGFYPAQGFRTVCLRVVDAGRRTDGDSSHSPAISAQAGRRGFRSPGCAGGPSAGVLAFWWSPDGNGRRRAIRADGLGAREDVFAGRALGLPIRWLAC